jgi:hypothetical protein
VTKPVPHRLGASMPMTSGFASISPTSPKPSSCPRSGLTLTLVDATLLVCALDRSSRFHEPCHRWPPLLAENGG